MCAPHMVRGDQLSLSDFIPPKLGASGQLPVPSTNLSPLHLNCMVFAKPRGPCLLYHLSSLEVKARLVVRDGADTVMQGMLRLVLPLPATRSSVGTWGVSLLSGTNSCYFWRVKVWTLPSFLKPCGNMIQSLRFATGTSWAAVRAPPEDRAWSYCYPNSDLGAVTYAFNLNSSCQNYQGMLLPGCGCRISTCLGYQAWRVYGSAPASAQAGLGRPAASSCQAAQT